MIKNNLMIMDMDEHTRKAKEKLFKKEIAACKVLGLNLNIASSDITLFVENNRGDFLELD